MTNLFLILALIWAAVASFGWHRARLRANRAEAEVTKLTTALTGLIEQCRSGYEAIKKAVHANSIDKPFLELSRPDDIVDHAEYIGDAIMYASWPIGVALKNLRAAGEYAVDDLLKVAARLDESRTMNLTESRDVARRAREYAGEKALLHARTFVHTSERFELLLSDAGVMRRALQRAFALAHPKIEDGPWFAALSRFMAGSSDDQAA